MDKFEVRPVIKFMMLQKKIPAEIYREMEPVFFNSYPSHASLKTGKISFKENH